MGWNAGNQDTLKLPVERIRESLEKLHELQERVKRQRLEERQGNIPEDPEETPEGGS